MPGPGIDAPLLYRCSAAMRRIYLRVITMITRPRALMAAKSVQQKRFAGKDEIPDGAGIETSGAAQTGQAASRGWPGRVRVKATGLGRGSGGGLGSGGVLRLPHSQFCQIQRTRWAAPQRIPRIGQRRQGNIIVRRARRRARAVHHCGDHFAHASAPRRRAN